MHRLALLAALLLPAIPAVAAVPSSFRHTAPLEGNLRVQEPAKVPLPRGVIARTGEHFVDLRLFDARGLETPYVIYPRHIPGRQGRDFSFRVVSFTRQGEWEEIVLRRPAGAGPYHRLDFFTSATNFKKTVKIEQSPGGRDWEELTADTLFDFSDRVELRKTHVDLPGTDNDYLRVLLGEDRAEQGATGAEMHLKYDGLDFRVGGQRPSPFKIEKVTGRGGPGRPTRPVFDNALFQQPRATIDEKGDTIIDLGRVNLPLAEITLTVDRPFYYRRVDLMASATGGDDSFAPVAGGRIYSIPGMSRAENTIACDRGRVNFARIRIVNQDNPPLGVLKVSVAWVRRSLYFIPEAGRTYSLYFGAENMARPRYELGMLIPRASADKDAFYEISVGNIMENQEYLPLAEGRPGREHVEKRAFTAVVLFLVCLMGVWVYHLLRKFSSES